MTDGNPTFLENKHSTREMLRDELPGTRCAGGDGWPCRQQPVSCTGTLQQFPEWHRPCEKALSKISTTSWGGGGNTSGLRVLYFSLSSSLFSPPRAWTIQQSSQKGLTAYSTALYIIIIDASSILDI